MAVHAFTYLHVWIFINVCMYLHTEGEEERMRE